MRFFVSAMFSAVLLTFAATAKADVIIDQQSAISGIPDAGDSPGFPVTINKPGTYRLESDLQPGGFDAIQINADDVTIDLNGYKISAVGQNTSGINLTASLTRAPQIVNLTIENGWINGFNTGISATTLPYVKIDHIIFTNNSFAVSAGDFAIITNNVLQSNQSGIAASSYARIENNIVADTQATPISASSYSTIRNNIVTGNAQDGINCADCSVISNILDRNGAGSNGMAIVIRGLGRVENNQISTSFIGISCDDGQCSVNNNTIRDVNLGISAACPSLIYNNNMFRVVTTTRLLNDQTQCQLANNIPLSQGPGGGGPPNSCAGVACGSGQVCCPDIPNVGEHTCIPRTQHCPSQ